MDALINVIVPVFGTIAAGHLTGRFNVLGPESAAALNRFVYFVALPPLLFVFTARAPIDHVLNWSFIGAFVGGGLLTLLIALSVGRVWFRFDAATLCLHGLTAMFGNANYMGVPLLLMAFGPDGALPAILASVISVTLFIGGAVASLEAIRAVGLSKFLALRHVAGTLARNPLSLAPLLGIAFSASALPIPKAVGNFLDLMAAAAPPAALFALGLSLVGRQVMGNAVEVIWLTLLKLGIQPLLTYLLVVNLFAMDPLWSQAAVILSAMPVAALVFVISQQYDVYVQPASTAIVVSTGISVGTISFLLIWFGGGD
jgi:malonate transporter